MNEINSSCNLEWRIFDFTHMAEGRVRDLENQQLGQIFGSALCNTFNMKTARQGEHRLMLKKLLELNAAKNLRKTQKAKRKHLLEYADAQYQDYAACQQHMVGLTRDLSSGR
uniref:Transposase n=1 Tax=Globodera pallida TaxID=36090 RepID=A0A183CDD4_GLOPA